MRKNSYFTPKQMVMLALLASIAYLMVSLIRIPVVMFLKYEPKDVIITIGGFLFGPTYGVEGGHDGAVGGHCLHHGQRHPHPGGHVPEI